MRARGESRRSSRSLPARLHGCSPPRSRWPFLHRSLLLGLQKGRAPHTEDLGELERGVALGACADANAPPCEPSRDLRRAVIPSHEESRRCPNPERVRARSRDARGATTTITGRSRGEPEDRNFDPLADEDESEADPRPRPCRDPVSIAEPVTHPLRAVRGSIAAAPGPGARAFGAGGVRSVTDR